MIELRRLRYLVTLAMRLSYARAAEDLGITPVGADPGHPVT